MTPRYTALWNGTGGELDSRQAETLTELRDAVVDMLADAVLSAGDSITIVDDDPEADPAT